MKTASNFTLGLAAILALASTAHAETNILNRSCWDGTFGYNYAEVQETHRGVEITLHGNTLQLPELYLDWNHALRVDSYSAGAISIHTVLPSSSKTVLPNGDIVIKAKNIVTTTAEGWEQVTHPVLWAVTFHRSLGQISELISDVQLNSITATLSKDNVSLSFDQYADVKDESDTVSLNCRHNSVTQPKTLTPKIAAHLDAKIAEARK